VKREKKEKPFNKIFKNNFSFKVIPDDDLEWLIKNYKPEK